MAILSYRIKAAAVRIVGAGVDAINSRLIREDSLQDELLEGELYARIGHAQCIVDRILPSTREQRRFARALLRYNEIAGY